MGTNLNQSKAAAGMTVTKGPIDLAQCDRSLSVVSLLHGIDTEVSRCELLM